MFKEWLQQLEEGALEASIVQNNMALSRIMGLDKNWFGMILMQAKKFVKGQDVLTVANAVANHMIASVDKPGDKFIQGIQQIRGGDPAKVEDSLSAFFNTASMLRARRFSREFNLKRDSLNVHMSGEKNVLANTLADKPVSNEGELERLKEKVTQELELMLRENPRNKRLQLALMVAPARMENAPYMTGMDELMARFPDIKKTTMFMILQDIQEAFYRVMKSQGSEGMASEIEKRRA